MARSQAGINLPPAPIVRVQILEVPDMPMNAMSVGQFSVWLPGLASQIIKEYPGDRLQVTIGFGYMFWILAWHGKRPRAFSPFEGISGENTELPEYDGDLWIHFSSNREDLIHHLIRETETHIGSIVRLKYDATSKSATASSLETAGSDFRIPTTEADFAQGCFVDVQLFPPGDNNEGELMQEVDTVLRASNLDGMAMIHHLPIESPEDPHRLMLLFHRDSIGLGEAMEQYLDSRKSPHDCPRWATRFFVPSLDVLTGLRQGGIRMNRFSPTQQWNQ